jgi:hypothetical protein
MCIGGSTPTMAPPPPVAKPAPAPKRVDPEVQKARARTKTQVRAMLGRQSTIQTGPRGLEDEANTRQRTLGVKY